MAQAPSPFGVPRTEHGRHAGFQEDSNHLDYDRNTAPTMRLSPTEMRLPPEETRLSPEEEMENHLERIQASRPLRRAAQRARRRTRWWLIALATVSGLAVMAACGAGAYIVLKEGETAPTAPPRATDAADDGGAADDGAADDAPDVVDPIQSRGTDAEPLTVAELFGADSFTPAGAAGAYELLQTEEFADCAEVGLDELATVLGELDCTQAIRATVVNPGGDYAATAGVLNLADSEEAETLRTQIDEGIEGGFAALRTDGAGSELGRSPTMVGYNTYGHYLLYVVIGRVDGEALEDADENVLTIVGDIVDVWLIDQLLPRRTIE